MNNAESVSGEKIHAFPERAGGFGIQSDKHIPVSFMKIGIIGDILEEKNV